MDFVTDRFESGRMFRILTLIDAYTREALRIWAEVGMSGTHVAAQLREVCKGRPRPEAIRVENGSEFYSKAMDAWAYQNRVRLDFIRPGKPVENGYIESFNGRLPDEWLNVHLFFEPEDAREKLEVWRHDYSWRVMVKRGRCLLSVIENKKTVAEANCRLPPSVKIKFQ